MRSFPSSSAFVPVVSTSPARTAVPAWHRPVGRRPALLRAGRRPAAAAAVAAAARRRPPRMTGAGGTGGGGSRGGGGRDGGVRKTPAQLLADTQL